VSSKELALQIKEIFDNNLFSFPINKQWHYAERLYRITGKNNYKIPILNYVLAKRVELNDLLYAVNNSEKQDAIGRKLIKRLESTSSERIKKRISIYQKYPKVKYLQEIIWFLQKYKEYNILECLNINFEETIKILQTYDYEKIFNEEILTVDPVQTVNTLFYLRNLNIVDIVNRKLKFIETIYKKTQSDFEFKNKLYFYTHIILQGTNFYQNYVHLNDYEKLFGFFEENKKRIFAINDNDDIVTEIGVCYKFAKIDNDLFQEKISKKALSDKRNNIIIGKELQKNLYQLEHTNVLAIILFSEFSKLYKGPNIEKILKEALFL
jgi:hypothetical protein